VGGDATENHDFQRGKQRLQGYKTFFSRCMLGAMRLKMTIFTERNSVCRVAFYETNHRFFKGGDPTKNSNFQREKVGLLWSKNFQKHNLFSK